MSETHQEIIFIVIAGTVILAVLAGFVVYFILYYQRNRQKHKVEKEQMELSFHQELLRSQLEIQEQTLKNISQDIHDNIGQTLSLAKLNLNTIPAEKQNGLAEKLTHTKDLVSKAIQDLRSLSKTLNTDTVLSAGLINAIEFELAQLQRSGVFATELNIIGTPQKLDSKKELILFRMMQEAVNNTIKHSEANEIKVTVEYNHSLTLTIADNGQGFNQLATGGFKEGLGLRNMRNRATLIGGTLGIQSNNRTGTQVSVTLPIKEQ